MSKFRKGDIVLEEDGNVSVFVGPFEWSGKYGGAEIRLLFEGNRKEDQRRITFGCSNGQFQRGKVLCNISDLVREVFRE